MTIHTMERLSAANPVPPSAREWIARDFGLDSIKPTCEPQTTNTRTALAIAAATLALLAATALLVAPALGLGIPGIDFFQAEKAPPEVVKQFADLAVGAPAGMDPQAIPGETRKVAVVTLSDGPHTLWVAPTKAGGLCEAWKHGIRARGVATAPGQCRSRSPGQHHGSSICSTFLAAISRRSTALHTPSGWTRSTCTSRTEPQ